MPVTISIYKAPPKPGAVQATHTTRHSIRVERHVQRRPSEQIPFVGPRKTSRAGFAPEDFRRRRAMGSAVPTPRLVEEPATAQAQVEPAPKPTACGDSAPLAAKKTRKYKKRTPSAPSTPAPLRDRAVLTFKEAAALYPASEQALRRLARNAEQYSKYPKAGLPSNGFDKCVIRHPGSRLIYLDAVQLAAWWTASPPGALRD